MGKGTPGLGRCNAQVLLHADQHVLRLSALWGHAALRLPASSIITQHGCNESSSWEKTFLSQPLATDTHDYSAVDFLHWCRSYDVLSALLFSAVSSSFNFNSNTERIANMGIARSRTFSTAPSLHHQDKRSRGESLRYTHGNALNDHLLQLLTTLLGVTSSGQADIFSSASSGTLSHCSTFWYISLSSYKAIRHLYSHYPSKFFTLPFS